VLAASIGRPRARVEEVAAISVKGSSDLAPTVPMFKVMPHADGGMRELHVYFGR
jgi:hypothetical protein